MIAAHDISVNTDRPWLAGKLRRESVPDWLWTEMERDGVTLLGRAQLLREARRRLRSIRPQETGIPIDERSPDVRVDDLLSPAEADRAWAFSEYIASQAAAEPDLQGFRSAYLDGRVLNEKEADQFMASEALLYLPASVLRSQGIPLWGHTVIKCHEKGRLVTYGSKDGKPRHMWRREVHIEISWNGRTVAFDPWMESSPEPSELAKIDLPTGPHWYPHSVWSGSVYDELRKITNTLTQGFPWNTPEATTYVLTGETPFIPPIYVAPVQSRFGAFGQVKLEVTIEPWVSAQTVTRFYKHLKRSSYPSRSRSMSAKNIALFRFVTQHAQPGKDVPSYESLVTLWNEAHPEWRYESAWMLARDYRRAGKLIVFPRYQSGAGAKRGRGPAPQTGGGGG